MDEVVNIEKVPLSCSSCRKKKAKCDRGQPCSACRKSRSACSYEKISRTPLTREHLTSVELELTKTKALLRQYEKARSVNSNDISPAPSRQQVYQDAGNGPRQIPTPQATHISSSIGAIRTTQSVNTSPAFSLETPPVGDLDWDERTSSLNDTRLNDLANGMASFVDRNGYMGAASGAALLRIAGDDSGEDLRNNNGQSSESAAIATPILPALYSIAQLEPWVDAYFGTYHISYPIIHEATFRAQFMEVVSRPNGQSWHVLLYIIAAIGCFASSESTPEADIGLFDAAKRRLSIDMLETGNVTLVQALTLISNYIQKRNRPNSGYNYMGIAKRMAWGLALHKEFPAWKEQPFRLELRRRVWWCIYVFDFGGIITFSRPLDIPADGIDVGLPLNVNESEVTPSTTRLPQESNFTTLYTHVRCQSLFHLATYHIYQRLISTIPSAEDMLQLDSNHLQKWLSETPSYFAGGVVQPLKYRLCHAVLQWRWRNFRILMFRPYLIRKFINHRHNMNNASNVPNPDLFEEAAIRLCLETARESIQMIAKYWKEEKQNVLTCWYALYFLFQAVLVPTVSLRNDSYSEAAPGWRLQILEAQDVMADMSRMNSAATRCHAVVTKLCGAYFAADISQWESPTNESPQTQMNALYSYMFGPITDSQFFDFQNFQMEEPFPMDFTNLPAAP